MSGRRAAAAHESAPSARSARKATDTYRDRNSTSDRTLDILEMFGNDHLVVRASDLVERLQVARSTAYRYLQTLTSRGFLEETAGGYRLGLKVSELALVARRAYGTEEIVRPILEGLARETGSSALFTRRSGVRVVCVERAEPPSRHLQLSYEPGTALTLNAGAAAEVVLAWEPPEVIADLLSRADLPAYTRHSLTSVESMTQRLADIRAEGVVVAYAELDLDTVGIAAPVWQNGSVMGGVSVAAVGARIPSATIAAHTSKVRQAAEFISERMDAVMKDARPPSGPGNT